MVDLLTSSKFMKVYLTINVSELMDAWKDLTVINFRTSFETC